MGSLVDPADPAAEDWGGNLLSPDEAPETPSSAASLRSSTSSSGGLSRTYIKDELRCCLSSVKYVGDIMSYRASQQNVDPGLHINNVGNISLPLREEDAKLIMKAGRQAPFGRGSETIVDTSFRNTKQLDIDSFQLRNPAWTQYLQDIIKPLGVGLGFQDSPSGIKAELYKLLLYEEGAMFKPHKDSEKADGMFGTLVVCLPSKHEGGDVVLTHRGDVVIVKSSEASEFGQTHIAWYSDVVHEIKPVTAGYRLVLTYNLHQGQEDCPTTAETIIQERAILRGILKEWKRRYEANQPTINKLAYHLDHEYSEANLRFERLKGRDRLLGRYLNEACGAEGFTVLLANLTLTIYNAEESQMEDEDCQNELRLHNLVNMNGREILDSANLEDEEIVQYGCYDRLPDEIDSKETGNEGIDATHFYRDTVIILMPSAFLLEFRLATLTHDSIINWIKSLMAQFECQSSKSAREDLVRICTRESQAFSSRAYKTFDRRPEEILRQCIKACEVLQDHELLLKITEGCYEYDLRFGVYEAFIETLHTFDFDKVRPRHVSKAHLPKHFWSADSVASLDRLTSRKTHLHSHLNMLATLRRHYQSTKSDNRPLTELSKYEDWEKSIIKQLLESANRAEYESTLPLMKVVERLGEEFSIKNVLPFLNKDVSATATLVAFLAEMYIAVRDEHIPDKSANPFFETLLKPTASKLSLELLHPKQKTQEPCWWDFSHPGRMYEPRLAEQVACFYCLCRLRGSNAEAGSLLAWLKEEADSAHVAIFPYLLLPLLKVFRSSLAKYNITVSAEIKETCVYIATKLQTRCVGLEPAKPSNWSREPKGCKDPDCTLCPKLNVFLADPEKEEEIFVDNRDGHLRRQAGYSLEIKYAGGSSLKITKKDTKWESEHRRWQERFDSVRKKLPLFDAVKDLYGERCQELQSMRGIT